MRKTILYYIVGLLLVCTNLYAANGDLIVNGNVGIGVTPSAKLHVSGTIRSDIVPGYYMDINSYNAANLGYQLLQVNDAAHSGYDMLFNNWSVAGNGGGWTFANTYLNAGVVRITSTGNVGIGTTQPTSKLQVNGGATNGFYVTTNDCGPWGFIMRNLTAPSSFNMFQDNTGNTHMYSPYPNHGLTLTTSGNVGIGTTYPGSNKLYVYGNFAASGSKNFDIKDPRYDDYRRRLIHASLEGPEAGVYYRGEIQLVNGRAIVTLPSYFEALTGKDNRTVLLTLKFEQEGELLCSVAASGVKNGQFTILAFGVPDPSKCVNKVFWEVKAERGDMAKLTVEEIREDYPEKDMDKTMKPFNRPENMSIN